MSETVPKCKMISYAQNFEDVMLNRVFRDRTHGFYVDVGAADPVNLSVTKWFYDLGWTGINIEPHPEFFQKLEAERPRDINLNCGAGAINGEAVLREFAMKEWSSFCTTVDAKNPAASPVATRSMPVSTLDKILETHAPERQIDFLKIDVEGWETEVLQGINLRRHRPAIILVEAVDRDTHEVNSDWEDKLFGSGYKLNYFDGLNKFYSPAEACDIERHFAVPPNVFDNFQLSIHVEQQEQIVALRWMVEHSDEDRESHLKQIHQLTDMIKATEADSAARLEQIHVLTNQIHNIRNQLTESEPDRAVELDGIIRLSGLLQATEADRTLRLKEIQLLASKLNEVEARRTQQRKESEFVSQQIETMKSMMKTLEGDRAARLEQIHQLTDWLKESNAERMHQYQESQRLAGLLGESESQRLEILQQYRRVARVGPFLLGLSSRK